MRFKVGTLVLCLGNVDALELEDDRARAIIAAGYHHAVVVRPLVHECPAIRVGQILPLEILMHLCVEHRHLLFTP